MGKAENDVERHLIEQAEANNFIHYKFLSTTRGVPDQIIVGNGHTVFVETKSPIGQLETAQRIAVARLRRRGAWVAVTKTKDAVDDLIHRIKTT